MLTVWFFVYKKLAQFAVRGALPPRRSESPGCAADNKPSCVLHLLGSFIGSRGFSSLEQRPEFWVLQEPTWKVKVLVTQSCLTLCDPMDLPGSSVQGISQARILECVVISFSRGYSWPRDWTCVSCIAAGFFTIWAIMELLGRAQGCC